MADRREFEIDGKLLSSLRVVDLKQELEKRGLSKSGSKKDLVDRLKMQLKLERLHESASTDEGHVPNLKLQDEIAEPNDLIKEYLAKQQKIYEIQKEARRRVELEEQQVRESSEASAGDTSQEEEELEQIRLQGEREKQQKSSFSIGETSFGVRNVKESEEEEEKQEREVYEDAAVDLTGSSSSHKGPPSIVSEPETQRELSSKESSEVTAQSIEETKEAIRALSRDSGNDAHSPIFFSVETPYEGFEAVSEHDSNMAEDLSVRVNVPEDREVVEDVSGDVPSEKEAEEQETLKIQSEEQDVVTGHHIEEPETLKNQPEEQETLKSPSKKQEMVKVQPEEEETLKIQSEDVETLKVQPEEEETPSIQPEKQETLKVQPEEQESVKIEAVKKEIKPEEEETLNMQPKEQEDEVEKMEGIEEDVTKPVSSEKGVEMEENKSFARKKKDEEEEPERIKIVVKESEDGNRGRREEVQTQVEEAIPLRDDVKVSKGDEELVSSPAPRARPRLKRMQGKSSTPAPKKEEEEEKKEEVNEEAVTVQSRTEDIKEPDKPLSSHPSPLVPEISECLVDDDVGTVNKDDHELRHTEQLSNREKLEDEDGSKNMKEEEVGSSSSNEQEETVGGGGGGVSSRNSSRSSARERNGRRARRRSSGSSSRGSSSGSSSSRSRSRSKSSSSSSGSSSGSRSPPPLRSRTEKKAEESLPVNEDSTSRVSPRPDTTATDDADVVTLEVEDGITMEHSVTPQEVETKEEETVTTESVTNTKEVSPPAAAAVVVETQTRITTRKISISSSKDRKEENGDGGVDKPRRRKWGGGSSTTVSTVKRPSFSISTDSLKGLIPDVHVKTPVETIEIVSFREETSVPPKKIGIENDSGTANSAKRETIVWSTPQDDSKPEKPPKDDVAAKISQRITTQRVSVTSSRKQSPPPSSVRRSPSPARNPPGCIVHIRNLVRPFTLNQLKELLSQTGTLADDGFWIDKIKSKCYVTYLKEEDAVVTRHALHGTHWPSSNPKMLVVDYATRDELDFHRNLSDPLEGPKVVQGGVVERNSGKLSRINEAATVTQNAKDRRRIGKDENEPDAKVPKRERRSTDRSNNNTTSRHQPIREWDRDKIGEKSPGERARATRAGGRRGRLSLSRSRSRGRSPHLVMDDRTRGLKERDRHVKGEPRDRRDRRDRRREEEEAPAKLLDDLFRKTKTTPCIYWLPLTADQILAKEDERKQRQVEREKRRQLETTDKDRPIVGIDDVNNSKKIRERDESRNRRRSHSPGRSRNRRR